MRLSTQIKPISYVKANAAEIIAELNDGGDPIVVTQNGEAKAVVMSVHEYERTQETLGKTSGRGAPSPSARQSRTSGRR